MVSKALVVAVLGIALILSPYARGAAPNVSKGVAILKVQFNGGGPPEVGTGFFVDHDGLLITAAHVLKGMENDTARPRQAAKITLYIAGLKESISLDVLGGTPPITYGGYPQGLDIALIRVPLSEADRARIVPLDIAQDAPDQGQVVYAFGPACADTDPERANVCFRPFAVRTTIANSTIASTQYTIVGTIKPGYSGGPLLDESGKVLGVCSHGTVDLTGNATWVSYTPIRFFLFRMEKLVPVSHTIDCAYIKKLDRLTSVDLFELSTPWQANPNIFGATDQCVCCCDALSKTSSALLGLRFDNQKCTPPSPNCTPQVIFASVRAMSLELNLNPPDVKVASAWYGRLQNLYFNFGMKEESFSSDTRESIDVAVGDMFAMIAKDPALQRLPQFKAAASNALMAYLNSNRIKPRSDVYRKMTSLFELQGEQTAAIASGVLAQYTDAKEGDPKAARKIVQQLKINPDLLDMTVDETISASVAAAQN
jgi:hypothetical protein